jgi:hypothetical protein
MEGVISMAPMSFTSLFTMDGQDIFKEPKDITQPLVQKMIQKNLDRFFKEMSEAAPVRILPLMSKTRSQETKGLAVFLESKTRYLLQSDSFDDIAQDLHQTMQKASPIPVYLAKSEVYPHLREDLDYLERGMNNLERFAHGEEVSISLDFHKRMKNLEQIFERSTLNKTTSLVQRNHALNRL